MGAENYEETLGNHSAFWTGDKNAFKSPHWPYANR